MARAIVAFGGAAVRTINLSWMRLEIALLVGAVMMAA
jgi:hypothetical protein